MSQCLNIGMVTRGQLLNINMMTNSVKTGHDNSIAAMSDSRLTHDDALQAHFFHEALVFKLSCSFFHLTVSSERNLHQLLVTCIVESCPETVAKSNSKDN